MMGGRNTVGRTTAVADPFQMILVRWADAHAGEGSWHQLENDEAEEHIVSTCGWLIPDTEGGKPGHVTVAQNVDPQELVDHVIYIPKDMVRSLTFLEAFSKPMKG